MDTLEQMVAKKIKTLILNKEIPYSNLDELPLGCRQLVNKYLMEHDKAVCQMKIMDALAEITLLRSEEHWAEWEKFYDEDGYRDFAEVIYVKNSGEINHIAPWNSEFYYQHINAFRKINPYEEELEDWENDVGFPGI